MPIVVSNDPIGLYAQAAQNVGANRNSAINFQQQLQQQEASRQQDYLNLRLQQEEDQRRQQDFRDSLNLAQYNRQSQRDQDIANYQQGSLAQRTSYQQGSLAERAATRQQRMDIYQQRVANGTATLAEKHQNAIDMAERQAELRINAQREHEDFQQAQQGRGFENQKVREDARFSRLDAANRARQDLEKARQGDLTAHRELQNHIRVLSLTDHDLRSQLADAAEMEQSYIPSVSAEGRRRTSVLRTEQQNVVNLLRELTNTPAPGAPMGQPTSGEYPGPEGNALPGGMPSNESGAYIGQIITNPNGVKGKVVGIDLNGKAQIEVLPG